MPGLSWLCGCAAPMCCTARRSRAIVPLPRPCAAASTRLSACLASPFPRNLPAAAHQGTLCLLVPRSLNSSERMSSIIFGQGAISCVGAGMHILLLNFLVMCNSTAVTLARQSLANRAGSLQFGTPQFAFLPCSAPPHMRSHHVRRVAPPLCGAHPVPCVGRPAGWRPAG